MKLTHRIRQQLNRKFRSNWSQENMLTAAFKNQVYAQLYKKVKGAKTADDAFRIINQFDFDEMAPFVNSFASSLFARSTKEFKTIIEAFVVNPMNKRLNLRSAGLLQRQEDFRPFLNAFKHNISLIKDLPRDLGIKLKTAYMTGTSFRGTDFARELTERLGKKAKTIIRTESAKIVSSLTQARMQKLGLAAYIWSTSEDSRVRGSHSQLDGVLIFWNDPPTIDNYQNHVGRFVNCRCVAIPIVSVSDIQFPIAVAVGVNIQTTWVKGVGKEKGHAKSRIVSGSISIFSKEKFLETFGKEFT